MKFSVKSIVAYVLVACMLMTFMPVISAAEETEATNYVYSDFGADRALTVGNPVYTGNHVVLPVGTNDAALYGYTYAKGEYTLDETKVGLYHTVDGTYVTGKADNTYASGSEYLQTKSPFINDFEFQATFNGTKYTLPILSYGKTSGHDTFQFKVDASSTGLSDAAGGNEWSTTGSYNAETGEGLKTDEKRAQWTDVKIVHKATGKELAARATFGLYSPFRIDFCTVQAIAEAFPEYFYVGPKVTAEGTKSGYILGYGDIANASDTNLCTSCDLMDVAELKFTYNGAEYQMPLKGMRGSATTLYLALSYTAFNEATGATLTSETGMRDLVVTNNELSNFKLTAKKYSIGEFPEGTLFVSGMNVLAENGKTGSWTDTSSNVKFVKGNTEPLNYAFTVPTAGEYDVYCLTWDCDDDAQRAGKVLINGVLYDFTKCTLGPEGEGNYAPYWEPAGTITLSKDAMNVLTVPLNIGHTDSNPRFGGIAFVPASANFTMDSTLSAKLANKDTGLVDLYNEGTTLANLSNITISKPVYDSQTFTVKVNGTEYTVAAGTANDIKNAYTDIQGNFIDGATVADALTAAGVSKRNASGQVNAVLVNGKNVYPDRTLLYDGMEITTVDGADVTKANFSPVLKNTLVNRQYSESTPPANGVCIYTDNYGFCGTAATYVAYNIHYTKVFPFATQVAATTTAAADDNLINCQLHGFLSVLPSGAAEYGVSVGDKVYFTGNLIYQVDANGTKIYTATDASGNKTIATNSGASAFTVSLPDGKKAHAPYAFKNQQSLADNSKNYDASEVFIANTSAVNEITAANKIKDGKWQLLTTGTVPCQIMIVGANGAVKSILKDQVVTGIAPLTLTLEEGEKAYVWKSSPYNGTATAARIWDMKPLCDVLTY